MGAVVIADPVGIDAGMGLGDLFEEGEELDAGVPRVTGVRADPTGRDLQCGEQLGGAVTDVVLGLSFGQAGTQRQHRLRAIQCLYLALLVDADPHRALGDAR